MGKFIEKNRYKISCIMVIITAVFGFILNNINGNSIDLKTWILSTDKLFSLWWNIKFYTLMLVSYELFLRITNYEKKMSAIGMCLVVFSGVAQWNFTKIDSIIFGELIVVLLQKFIEEKDSKKSMLFLVGIAISMIAYSHTFVGFLVSYLPVFVALIIWIILKDLHLLKSNKNKIIQISVTAVIGIIASIILLIVVPNNYIDNYETGFSIGTSGLLSYLYNPLLPFKEFKYRELLGGFVCAFPIPLLVSLYYLYKNEKHTEFLMPLTIVTVIELFFALSGIGLIQKIPGLENLCDFRIATAIEYANLLIMFYFLANVKEKMFKLIPAMRITVVAIIFLYFLLRYPTVYASGFLYLFVCEFTMFTFLFLNYSDKKYQKLLLYTLLIVTLITGVPVCFLA